jgi:hypothetical protein
MVPNDQFQIGASSLGLLDDEVDAGGAAPGMGASSSISSSHSPKP